MRVLLDECVPTAIRQLLPDHTCATVAYMGWAGIKNGELLRFAESRFDVFLTSDQNLRYQRNLVGRRIAVVQLSTNNLRRLVAAGALIQSAVTAARPGEVRVLEIP